MSNKYRRKQICYAITAMFEHLEYEGIITRKEVNYWYNMLGRNAGLYELLPRRIAPNPTDLVEEIRSRIDRQQRRNLMAPVPSSTMGLIIHRKEGVVLPEAYLKKVMAAYSTCFCHSIVEKEKVEPVAQENALPSLTELKEQLDAFPAECLLYFGKKATPFSDEDFQPFDLINGEDGSTLLAAYLEGDFPNYQHPESEHTNEFFVINEYLSEKVRDIYADQDQDLAKTLKKLAGPMFHKEMRNVLAPRGSIVMIAGTGEIIPYSQNDLSQTFNDGAWWTSNHLDYTGEESTEKALEDMSPLERWKAMQALKNKGGSAPVVVKEPVVSKAHVQVPKKTETNVPEKMRMVPVPEPCMHDLGKKRSFYVRNFHQPVGKDGIKHMPQDWEKAREFPYDMLLPNSALREEGKALGNLKESLQEAAKLAAADSPTLVPEKMRTEVVTNFLPKYQWGSEELVTMEQVKEWIKDDYTFTSQHKDYDMDLAMFWPREAFFKLICSHPKSANALMCDMRNVIIEVAGDEIMKEITNKYVKQDVKDKKKNVM